MCPGYTRGDYPFALAVNGSVYVPPGMRSSISSCLIVFEHPLVDPFGMHLMPGDRFPPPPVLWGAAVLQQPFERRGAILDLRTDHAPEQFVPAVHTPTEQGAPTEVAPSSPMDEHEPPSPTESTPSNTSRMSTDSVEVMKTSKGKGKGKNKGKHGKRRSEGQIASEQRYAVTTKEGEDNLEVVLGDILPANEQNDLASRGARANKAAMLLLYVPSLLQDKSTYRWIGHSKTITSG
jgi:hypothetical protein